MRKPIGRLIYVASSAMFLCSVSGLFFCYLLGVVDFGLWGCLFFFLCLVLGLFFGVCLWGFCGWVLYLVLGFCGLIGFLGLCVMCFFVELFERKMK